MTRINTGISSGVVLRFKNKNTRILAKQAEIKYLTELMKEGAIDPEEAERRIAALEAQIQELETGVPVCGSDVEIDPLRSEIFELGAPDESDKPEKSDNEYGRDDIYSSQADIMKLYHGLN